MTNIVLLSESRLLLKRNVVPLFCPNLVFKRRLQPQTSVVQSQKNHSNGHRVHNLCYCRKRRILSIHIGFCETKFMLRYCRWCYKFIFYFYRQKLHVLSFGSVMRLFLYDLWKCQGSRRKVVPQMISYRHRHYNIKCIAQKLCTFEQVDEFFLRMPS